MPNYRYEAKDSRGVPVFGSVKALDRAEVEARLASQNLILVELTEISLQSTTARNLSLIDRLFQLQVGEQLREAVLTEIPVHVALRSMARDITRHPATDLCSWAISLGVVVLALLLLVRIAVDVSLTPILLTAVFTFLIFPGLRFLFRWIFEIRPRQSLNKMAEQMESGHDFTDVMQHEVTRELRPVITANITSDQKARVTSEVTQQFANGDLAQQQLTVRLLGPAMLIATMIFGTYSLLYYVIPMFSKLFRDFDTDLPSMTLWLMQLSDFVVSLGIPGLLLLVGCLVIGIVGFLLITRSSRAISMMARIPLIGLPFRWAMLSRIAELLASMIRNGCDYSESILAATTLSPNSRMQQYGRELASCLQSGKKPSRAPVAAQGLPFSLLFVRGQNSNEQQQRSGIAATFENLSRILQMASLHQTQMLVQTFHALSIIVICSTLGTIVTILFLPLIRLLNDLA